MAHASTVLLVTSILSACSVSVSTKAVGPCSPSYSINNSKYGRATAQQLGRGGSIQWGVVVVDKYKIGTQFVVAVYAGREKVDGKNQNYEPHGSIAPAKAAKYSGKLLEIIGTGKHGHDTLNFDLKCTIA